MSAPQAGGGTEDLPHVMLPIDARAGAAVARIVATLKTVHTTSFRKRDLLLGRSLSPGRVSPVSQPGGQPFAIRRPRVLRA